MGKLTRIVKFIAAERRLSIPAEFLHAHSIERGSKLVVTAHGERLVVATEADLAAWNQVLAVAERLFPGGDHPFVHLAKNACTLRLGSQDRVVLPKDFPFRSERPLRLRWDLQDGLLTMEPETGAERADDEDVQQRSLLDYMSANHSPTPTFEIDDAGQSLIEEVSVARIDPRDRTWANGAAQPSDAMLRSIRVEGVRRPIVLREREGGAFQVIDGFRRLQAARQLKLRSVPAVVWRGLDDDGCRRLKLLEPGRADGTDATPRHRLQSTVRLHEDQVALKEIEHITGRRKRTLQRYLRVAQDRHVKDAVEGGRLSIFKAEEILKAGLDPDEAIREGWTVKEIRDRGRRNARKRTRRVVRIQGDA